LADQDGNPLTQPDASFTPLLVTPPFPEYPSAHSTISSAAAAVLAEHFGNDTAFTVSSDVTSMTRHFASFSAALDDIRSARVNAGIHFRTACNDGQVLGTEVANYAIEHAVRHLRNWHDRDDDN